MNSRLCLLAAALTLVACAGSSGSKSASGGGTTATENKQRLANIVPFDLGNCFPEERTMPKPANAAALTGFWVSVQPRLSECLVDPKNRGADKNTVVNVKGTLDESGLKYTVTAPNLTPAGTACVQGVLDGIKADPLAKAKKPVTFENKIEHQVGREPAVEANINESSDVAALVRLAEPQWCECYADWKTNAPHTLKAKFTLHAKPDAAANANKIELAPTNDPVADKVGECVKGKLAALPYAIKSDSLSVGFPLIFINTSLDKNLSDDQPGNVRVAQLDGLRGQRNADAALAASSAGNAAVAYGDLVNRYKAKDKSVTVKSLKERCEELLKADDEYLKTLGAMADIDQRTLALATSLKAQDAAWNELETAAKDQVDKGQKDITKAKQAREGDAAACPKVKYSK